MALFDFSVAVNVMAAYVSGDGDEESMASARRIADGYDPKDVIDSLVFLNASLINLRTEGLKPTVTVARLRPVARGCMSRNLAAFFNTSSRA